MKTVEKSLQSITFQFNLIYLTFKGPDEDRPHKHPLRHTDTTNDWTLDQKVILKCLWCSHKRLLCCVLFDDLWTSCISTSARICFWLDHSNTHWVEHFGLLPRAIEHKFTFICFFPATVIWPCKKSDLLWMHHETFLIWVTSSSKHVYLTWRTETELDAFRLKCTIQTISCFCVTVHWLLTSEWTWGNLFLACLHQQLEQTAEQAPTPPCKSHISGRKIWEDVSSCV